MRKLTVEELRACVHPDEKMRFILAMLYLGPGLAVLVLYLIFSSLLSFLMLSLGFGVFGLIFTILSYAFLLAVILVGMWLVTLFALTALSANAAEISAEALPELEDSICGVCEALSYNRSWISAYLIQDGDFDIDWDSYWLWRRDILTINSAVAEATYDYDAPGELSYLLASEIGKQRALRLRPLFLGYYVKFVSSIPAVSFWVLPYIRATTYTGDQIALAATGDLRTALDAMSGRIVGKDLASLVATVGWMDQHRQRDWSFVSFLLRAFSEDPHPVDRIANLLCFAKVSLPRRYEELVSELPAEHRGRIEAMVASSRHARSNMINE